MEDEGYRGVWSLEPLAIASHDMSTQQSLPLVEARWAGAERGLIPKHESVCLIPGSMGQERSYALPLNQHDKASCRTQTVTVEQMGDRSATMIH